MCAISPPILNRIMRPRLGWLFLCPFSSPGPIRSHSNFLNIRRLDSRAWVGILGGSAGRFRVRLFSHSAASRVSSAKDDWLEDAVDSWESERERKSAHLTTSEMWTVLEGVCSLSNCARSLDKEASWMELTSSNIPLSSIFKVPGPDCSWGLSVFGVPTGVIGLHNGGDTKAWVNEIGGTFLNDCCMIR